MKKKFKKKCPECQRPRLEGKRLVCEICENNLARYKKRIKTAKKIKEKLRSRAMPSAQKARTYLDEMEVCDE